jgi:hypothetical protein
MGLAFCYSVYPVFAGQFWAYHWLPFLYFIVLLSSLCFVEHPKKTSPIKQLLPVVIVLLTVFIRVGPPQEFFTQIKGHPLEAPKHGRVDEIAAYLKTRMAPGDKVQPLDWTSGAVHAMLIAKAQIATPFVYDFHFYHHVSSAYIQNLREQFLESLKASKPRFVIQMTKKSRVSGLDTTQTFEGLEHLLNTYYLITQRGNGYVIYERANNEGTLQGGDEG